MSSTCITSKTAFQPVVDRRFPSGGGGGGGREAMVVDSKSCRQLYLRTAYTFTRREEKEKDGMEKAKKCLGKVKDRVSLVYEKKIHHANKSLKFMRNSNHSINHKSLVVFSKVKEFSYASLMSMLSRMLACTNKVDAVDH